MNYVLGDKIYTALFVENISELLKIFTPLHSVVFGHHVTLEYDPENLNKISVGKKHKVKIIARVVDDKADILLVETNLTDKKFPHITLSCKEGVRRSYSNELLEKAFQNKTIKYFTEPVEIDFVEGYFDPEIQKDVIS
jgi:hypothetical protein